ncbi:unnamed protein product [Discosporangium mesarthrocarpum]
MAKCIHSPLRALVVLVCVIFVLTPARAFVSSGHGRLGISREGCLLPSGGNVASTRRAGWRSAQLTENIVENDEAMTTPRGAPCAVKAFLGSGSAIVSGFVIPSVAVAKYVDPDDVGSIAKSELPPMWVPVVLGAVLFAGIALLQSSLGDVMNDEAKLGKLSGARAAKQSARDRSMFKKK